MHQNTLLATTGESDGLVHQQPKHTTHQWLQKVMLFRLSCHLWPRACRWMNVEEDTATIVADELTSRRLLCLCLFCVAGC